MGFFRDNEKVFVKSLIYGFIGGLYYSILFIPRTEEIITQGDWTKFSYQELTVFEYIIKVLQTSIIVSIGTFAVALIYLYYKWIKSSN